jgi:hypothetical protein
LKYSDSSFRQASECSFMHCYSFWGLFFFCVWGFLVGVACLLLQVCPVVAGFFGDVEGFAGCFIVCPFFLKDRTASLKSTL